MALPIYGKFLQKVYADESLRIEPNAKFMEPAEPLNIELDCSRYRSGAAENDDYDELMY